MSYLKKKKFRGSNKSNKCYICKKKGHFAKNCPNKAKSIKLVDCLSKKMDFDLEEKDVEFIFSLEDKLTSKIILALKTVDSSDNDVHDFYKVSLVNQPIHLIILTPITLFPDKWS